MAKQGGATFFETARWALTGAPLPKRFSVSAILLDWRIESGIREDSVEPIRVFEGPLAGRTIFLTFTFSDKENELAQHHGAFLDPVNPTHITAVPRVRVCLPQSTANNFHEALSIATSGGSATRELLMKQYPRKDDGTPDWGKVQVQRPSMFFYFDVELPNNPASNPEAVITHFRYELPNRFPARKEWGSRPRKTLPVRAVGRFSDALYSLSSLLNFGKFVTALRRALNTATLPRAFEVVAIHSKEGQWGWYADRICSVRRLIVTSGPLAGATLMLRLYQNSYVAGVESHIVLPAPFGPGRALAKRVAILEDTPEKLKDVSYRLSHQGNPERFGELIFVASVDDFERLTVGDRDNVRVRFFVTRKGSLFSGSASVASLIFEPVGERVPSIFEVPSENDPFSVEEDPNPVIQ